jgi:hypothetical protein
MGINNSIMDTSILAPGNHKRSSFVMNNDVNFKDVQGNMKKRNAKKEK